MAFFKPFLAEIANASLSRLPRFLKFQVVIEKTCCGFLMLFLYSGHCLLTRRSNSVTVTIVTIMFE
jgi:hypothetical protein